MNNRIKEIRTDQGMTLEKFGERLGLKKSALSLIENGKANVSEHVIVSICREFNVKEEWLRYGTGEKYHPLSNIEHIAALTKTLLQDEPDSFKNRFISMLDQLDDEQWLLLEDMCNKIVKEKD